MAGTGFSTPGTYSPLQLIAGAGLLQNQGIAVPEALTNAVSSYNSTSFVENLNDAIAAAPGFGISASVVTTLKTLASNTCPALGSSVPGSYAGNNVLIPASEPGGFGNLVANNAAMYLGDGSVDKFCQIFQIVSGYRQSANELICSAVNATTYLGPTFTTLNDLITGQLTAANLALKCFGADIAKSGNLLNLGKLDEFGTPSSVLQQISEQAGITSGTLSCIATKLAEFGLTQSDIILLATPEASERNPTENEFNTLQKQAYAAMVAIDGDCLTYALDILDAVIPDIENLADLLDLKKIFPTSWPSMTVVSTAPVTVVDPSTPPPPGSITGSNSILIFEPDGSVNPAIQAALNDSTAITLPAGCDELAKIIPPDQAVANKAFQSSLQQVSGISTITAPQLAAALLG
jgi:hypothetical protein